MSKRDMSLFTPVMIASSIILMLGFSVRASYGVFQIPIADDFGWLRSEFSLAIAIQNLAWGIGQPLFGAFAEKFGDRRGVFAELYLQETIESSGVKVDWIQENQSLTAEPGTSDKINAMTTARRAVLRIFGYVN